MRTGHLGWSLALLIAPQGGSHAADPTPSSCTVSPLVACPAGDLPIRVVVKRGKTPVPGSTVTLDLSGCTEVKLAAPRSVDPHLITDGCRVSLATNAQGVAELRIRAGGASSCSRIVLHAEGAMIAERSGMASPDQDGNLQVDLSDLALLKTKLGAEDPSGDLDGDGKVTARGMAEARRHLGHQADVPTPVLIRTWGEIKTGYR
jgi:hypothetical protein